MNPISIEHRIRQALPQFLPEGSLVRTWGLHGGISASMTAFEVELPGGERKRFIARQPNDWHYQHDANPSRTEFRALSALVRMEMPVQRPYFVEEPADETDRTILILEYIEGAADASPSDVDDYVEQFATTLCRIHQAPWEGTDLASLRPLPPNHPPPSGNLDVEMREGEIRAALEALEPHIVPNAPVLSHGDYWPGNTLWRDGRLVAVIDWESARIGDPLMDLAVARLDILWVFGAEAMRRMTEVYQTCANTDLTSLPYWDLRASLRPLSEFERMAPAYEHLGRPDITAATLMRDHKWFVEQAL